jgi:hypothetical protein
MNRGLWSVVRRYQTLVLFGTLVGCSSAFVACGSDDDGGTPGGGAGGKGGTSGKGGTAGRGGTSGDAMMSNDSATSSLEDDEEETQ